MQEYTSAREYLAKVLPFAEDGSTYVSVHWLTPKMGGRACQSVDEIINTIDYFSRQGNFNFFACMSSHLTAEHVVSQKGNPYKRPIRQQANVSALKSIWLDIDFKQYEDPNTCVRAIGSFLLTSKLPAPSMIVSTGGGFHIYWTFVEHLSPVIWEPIAHALKEAALQHGLKADTQCTVDSVRILRIPDTLNHKYDPPRLATIRHMGNDYFVQRLIDALLPYKVTTSANAMVMNLPPRTPLTEDALSSGIERASHPPINIHDVVNECPFIMQTLNCAGKDYGQTMWHLTVLMSTFTLQERSLAHMFSSGHDAYTPESTDAMFDRKVKEKAERGIGWPLCSTIAGNPEAQCCKTCPHLREGKSPFHFHKLHKANGHSFVITPPVTSSSNPQHLPSGYKHITNLVVAKEETDADGTIHEKPISSWPIHNAWLQLDEGKSMLYFASEIGGKEKQIKVEMAHVGGTRDFRYALQGQGLEIQDGQVKQIGGFFVSWITELKKHRTTPNIRALGWNETDNGLSGFSYGGQCWSESGSIPTPPLDDTSKKIYNPAGTPDPWIVASRMITDQIRPELNIILASAFAAPLVRLAGHKAYLLSAYSLDSGIGKTTAMKVALAAWGHPTKAMQSINDTQNAVNSKMGRVNSLPLYWDELRISQTNKSSLEFLLQLTSGREKDRLDVHANPREVADWHTILVCASNESVLNFVTSQSNTTAAAIYRMVEFPVTAGSIGQISVAKASAIINKLEYNYGHAGLQYAQYIGANVKDLEQEMDKTLEELSEELGTKSGERFWLVNFACLVLGAKYANQLGLTEIDEPAMKRFLTENFMYMRKECNAQVIDLKTSNADVTNLINQFLSETSSRNVLRTNIIYTGNSRPPLGTVRVIVGPQDAAFVQVGAEDHRIRIDLGQFERWLSKSRYQLSTQTILKEVVKHDGVTKVYAKIGAGTDKQGGQTALLDIDTTKIPELNIIG